MIAAPQFYTIVIIILYYKIITYYYYGIKFKMYRVQTEIIEHSSGTFFLSPRKATVEALLEFQT